MLIDPIEGTLSLSFSLHLSQPLTHLSPTYSPTRIHTPRYDIPLVADIHFAPAVALRVAEAFEKIRFVLFHRLYRQFNDAIILMIS